MNAAWVMPKGDFNSRQDYQNACYDILDKMIESGNIYGVHFMSYEFYLENIKK